MVVNSRTDHRYTPLFKGCFPRAGTSRNSVRSVKQSPRLIGDPHPYSQSDLLNSSNTLLDRALRPSGLNRSQVVCQDGQAAVPVGGGGAWPGFETTRRAKLAARTARGRAAAHGAARLTHSHTAPGTPAAPQRMFHVKHLPNHRPRYPVWPGKWHT